MAETQSGISLKEVAFCDLEREIAVTRRVLERVPAEKWDWAPHGKSMDLGRLTTHVATMAQWILMTLEADGIDFNAPPEIASKFDGPDEAIAEFDRYASKVDSAMDRLSAESLLADWSVCQGETVIVAKPRYAALRVWCVNHLVHHRAQLCVYLRMFDVPVPAIYFNSADEPEMVWE